MLNGELLTAQRYTRCDGQGFFAEGPLEERDCSACDGLGWFGIDPRLPLRGRPGSCEKVVMLAVRYASGVPLWNDADGLLDDTHAHKLAL